ncbi:amidohydrolase [Zhengella mangrovi]|uniref:Amidohydrolase n=1 Tax=Zhengella mangrovi TaxID=1982044 RepID=A0A2G1QIP8_9HYPH|nr:amidohydrolase family protein [Zhengella mangrovi]PHP65359.1 amidohydrolase [Zhengella mangrovi]
MTDFLIVNADAILTGLTGPAARASGAVRVRGGRIAAVGDLAPEPGERTVDASGCVVAPGLVNTHHHLFQSIMKAVPAGMNEALAAWLRLVPYTYWDRLTGPLMETAARVGMAELVLSGATTIADHHYFYSDRYDFDPGEILFDMADRFGIRFVLCRGGATKARAFDSAEITPLPTEPLDAMIAAVERDAKRWNDPAPDAMRRVVMAPTTPTFSLHEPELKEIASAARAMGLRLHSHLSENMDYVDHTTEFYGKRPVEWLAGHDWLGPDVWFAHLVECTPDEVKLLAETGTGMAHCPQANARLGSGVAPADLLHALGGTVSLAVDGAAANEAADMASTLYAAFSVHRAAKGVTATTAETVMHWATAGGARVLGLDAIGTLEPGKAADIVLFDLNAPRYFGQHDRAIAPVISGGDMRVRHSFVGGRPLVENGRVPWLDLDALGAEALAAVRAIATRP